MVQYKMFFLFTFVASQLFTTYFSDNPGKWKIGDKIINTSSFDIHSGQSAIYDSKFKNFNLKVHITHSEGAKANLWFHSDVTLLKGYSVLIGNPTGDRRRSGSLASIRNLYKPVPSSFDLEVKVEGKRIVVMIDGWKVVDYLEPADPFRMADNVGQLLTNGLIGFRVESGTLNVTDIDITPLADNLPDYPEDREPIDEQNDVLSRLQQRNFPVIDYHVHLTMSMGLKAALEKSFADGFEFGIATNCGMGFPITSNEQIKAHFKYDNKLPPLYYAMQGEGREWHEIFSKESREMFDYVFTDALTFFDHKGRRTQLWIPSTIYMDISEQEYMDMIMDRTLKIINEEPIDFLASPTRLSDAMMADYEKYWTDARVTQLIKALKDNNVALEINSVSNVPSARIIKAAKAAGIKFTLGTNNAGIAELDRLDYSLRMVEECSLTIDDMWFPKACIERYSVNPEIVEDMIVSNLYQPEKVNISLFVFEGDGGVGIPITDKDGIITRRKGVSQEMLTGYQKIVNKYLDKTSTGNPDKIAKFYWKSDFLSTEDWTRLYAIYVQMNDIQMEKQIIRFLGTLPLPIITKTPFHPPQDQYDWWIKDKKCNIWIDGEKADSEALYSYKSTDFVMSHTSTVFRSGGKIDDYRVDLWTEKGFNNFYEQFYKQPISIDKLLEIEPTIYIDVEKNSNNKTTLYFDAEPRNGWMKFNTTVPGTSSNSTKTPSTYHH